MTHSHPHRRADAIRRDRERHLAASRALQERQDAWVARVLARLAAWTEAQRRKGVERRTR